MILLIGSSWEAILMGMQSVNEGRDVEVEVENLIEKKILMGVHFRVR